MKLVVVEEPLIAVAVVSIDWRIEEQMVLSDPRGE